MLGRAVGKMTGGFPIAFVIREDAVQRFVVRFDALCLADGASAQRGEQDVSANAQRQPAADRLRNKTRHG